MSKVGHGDHWRAVLGEDAGALARVVEIPADAPDGIHLQRRGLTATVDLVQVTARRRLITAYPEPRATTLVRVTPRELLLWETRVEGWLVVDHEGAGALTVFLTDLVKNARRYERARGAIELEIGAIAYGVERAPKHSAGPDRLRPARERDPRFLADEYWFEAEVAAIHAAEQGEVLDLVFQGGLEVPVASRLTTLVVPGDRAEGYVWLTARWPEGKEEQGS